MIYREVIFSKTAVKKLLLLLEYLESKWSINVRKEFEQKLENSIEILIQMPESFPKSDIRKNHHKCVVTKQTTIYYRSNAKKIDISAIFDTRQHPNKIKKIK